MGGRSGRRVSGPPPAQSETHCGRKPSKVGLGFDERRARRPKSFCVPSAALALPFDAAQLRSHLVGQAGTATPKRRPVAGVSMFGPGLGNSAAQGRDPGRWRTRALEEKRPLVIVSYVAAVGRRWAVGGSRDGPLWGLGPTQSEQPWCPAIFPSVSRSQQSRAERCQRLWKKSVLRL